MSQPTTVPLTLNITPIVAEGVKRIASAQLKYKCTTWTCEACIRQSALALTYLCDWLQWSISMRLYEPLVESYLVQVLPNATLQQTSLLIR
jgi:hypothetical protein